MHLILCGYKSCGKTYLGTRVATRLQWDFVDVDRLLERSFKPDLPPQACSLIYQAIGEMAFRHLESKTIASLKPLRPSVIAPGAGAFLDPGNVILLKRMGPIIHLRVDPQVLLGRILSGPCPAILNPKALEESFWRSFSEREPIYRKVADASVDLTGKAEEAIIQEITGLVLDARVFS